MLRFLVAALLVSTAAHAGGRGGHYQGPLDQNMFPGATFWCALSSGQCSGHGENAPNAWNYVNATCNGSGTNDAGWPVSTWTANNPTLQVLYIPPGSRCAGSFSSAASSGGECPTFATCTGVQNFVVWGYGASIGQSNPLNGTVGRTAVIGSIPGFTNKAVFSAISSITTTGATQVSVSDGSQSSNNFAVGIWIAVTGLVLSPGGSPPTHQYIEYRMITAIGNGACGTACVFTLNVPLVNTYLSTWPNPNHTAGAGAFAQFGGPAAIFPMPPSWNTTQNWYGVTFVGTGSSSGGSTSVAGRLFNFYDIIWAGHGDYGFGYTPAAISGIVQQGTSPNLTVFDTVNMYYSNTGAQPEIDKEMINLNIYAGRGGGVFGTVVNNAAIVGSGGGSQNFQSNSPTNVSLINSHYDFIVGSPGNLTMIGGSTGNIQMGSYVNGHTNNVTLQNCTVGGATEGVSGSFTAVFSQITPAPGAAWPGTAGTFAISQNNMSQVLTGHVMPWAIPGMKYAYGLTVGGQKNIDPSSNACGGGRCVFTITAVHDDATNFYFDTDLATTYGDAYANNAPNPGFSGGSGNTDSYFAYPINGTLNQQNCGPANFNTNQYVHP